MDIGPLEIIPGTHLWTVRDGEEKMKSDDLSEKLVPIFMSEGDIIIRDVRTLHRGTPNLTNNPRPVVVVGYSRSWWYRPEVSLRISKHIFSSLTDEQRALVRIHCIEFI
mmetsp:Transcript_5751/g.10581  ORF Transcript_5751/g.10581 Transcript_5751/m.10581 type:complete len:109 (+) Transcript_5751:716-1042(+)